MGGIDFQRLPIRARGHGPSPGSLLTTVGVPNQVQERFARENLRPNIQRRVGRPVRPLLQLLGQKLLRLHALVYLADVMGPIRANSDWHPATLPVALALQERVLIMGSRLTDLQYRPSPANHPVSQGAGSPFIPGIGICGIVKLFRHERS